MPRWGMGGDGVGLLGTISHVIVTYMIMVVFDLQAIRLSGIHSSVQEVDGLLISVQMVGIS